MFWRFSSFGVRESKRAMTAMPVPPAMALHQLYSVPPTGRVVDSGTRFGSLIVEVRERKREREREIVFSVFFLGILK